MLKRPIPSSGEMLPVLGLGTYRAFGASLNPLKSKELRQVLRLFFESGGKVIDSSPMYGRAESVAGRLLAGMEARDKAFIATKVWTSGRRKGIDEMNASFEKLQAGPRIELMQVHNLIDYETHLGTLRDWKAEGRIKYIGITHYASSSFGQMEDIIRRHPEIDFCQFPYSIRDRAAEHSFLKFCADHGVATMINRPFDQDGLFRKVGQAPLPPLAGELGCRNWGQLLLKYVMAPDEVTSVIPATSNPEHMRDNLEAAEGRFPDAAERKALAHYFDEI